MKLSKKENRLRRARGVRSKIRELAANRLSIHRTPRHIYAQIIGANDNKILASASSLEAEVRKNIKNGGNVAAATIISRSKESQKKSKAFEISSKNFFVRL